METGRQKEDTGYMACDRQSGDVQHVMRWKIMERKRRHLLGRKEKSIYIPFPNLRSVNKYKVERNYYYTSI